MRPTPEWPRLCSETNVAEFQKLWEGEEEGDGDGRCPGMGGNQGDKYETNY